MEHTNAKEVFKEWSDCFGREVSRASIKDGIEGFIEIRVTFVDGDVKSFYVKESDILNINCDLFKEISSLYKKNPNESVYAVGS